MSEWLSVVATYSAIRVRCESVENSTMLIRDTNGEVVATSSHNQSLDRLRKLLFEIELELLDGRGLSDITLIRRRTARSSTLYRETSSARRIIVRQACRACCRIPGSVERSERRAANVLVGQWDQGGLNMEASPSIELYKSNTIEIRNKMPISPLAASLRDIVTLRDMQDANSASFKHAYMGSHLIFAVKARRIRTSRSSLGSSRRNIPGVRGVGQPPIIPADSVDIKATRPSNVDLQFIEGQKFEIEQIARGFAVPVILLQNIEASTYNNNIEARRDFYKTTIANEWRHIADEITTGLQLIHGFPPDWTIEFDDTIIKALEPSFWDRADSVLKLISSGAITINEVRKEIGFAEYPEGDRRRAACSQYDVHVSGGGR